MISQMKLNKVINIIKLYKNYIFRSRINQLKFSKMK